MNPGHEVKLEVCVCHSDRIKKPRGKHPRCRETGHWCKTKYIRHFQPAGGKKSPLDSLSTSEAVQKTTQRVMMPKIVDRILGSEPSPSPIRRSEMTQRYIELCKEQRTLIHRSKLWDYLWPFSRLNLVTKELSLMIEAGIEEHLRAENNRIRAYRRRMARTRSHS